MAKCFFVNGTASWYGPDLTCLPIGTCIHSTCHVPRASPATCPDCGRPQEILHGLTTAQHSCTSYRCEMTYSCQPGFQVSHAPTQSSPVQPMPRVQVVGGATRICQADGTWTRGDLPTCIPVQCDIPHNPVNGEHFLSRV